MKKYLLLAALMANAASAADQAPKAPVAESFFQKEKNIWKNGLAAAKKRYWNKKRLTSSERNYFNACKKRVGLGAVVALLGGLGFARGRAKKNLRAEQQAEERAAAKAKMMEKSTARIDVRTNKEGKSPRNYDHWFTINNQYIIGFEPYTKPMGEARASRLAGEAIQLSFELPDDKTTNVFDLTVKIQIAVGLEPLKLDEEKVIRITETIDGDTFTYTAHEFAGRTWGASYPMRVENGRLEIKLTTQEGKRFHLRGKEQLPLFYE